MVDQDFDVCHQLANKYFYFYFEGKKSFTLNVSNRHFVLWVYFNIDDIINVVDQLRTLANLAKEHKLKNKGWNELPDVTVYKASAYEVFDRVAAFVFSLK